MIKLSAVAIALTIATTAQAQTVQPSPSSPNRPKLADRVPDFVPPETSPTSSNKRDDDDIDLDGVTVPSFAYTAFHDHLNLPYTMSPEVYSDGRKISVHLHSGETSLYTSVIRYLDALGYSVDNSNGVLAIGPKAESKAPQKAMRVLVYRPRYRDTAYLFDQIKELGLDCKFGHKGSNSLVTGSSPEKTSALKSAGIATPEDNLAVAGNSASSLIGVTTPDAIVANCEPEAYASLTRTLATLDVREAQILVRATVYEVSLIDKTGSAITLASSILKSKLGVSIGNGLPTNTAALSLGTGDVQSIVSALDDDNRFRVLSSPIGSARSGSQAVLESGQEVPVLAGVSYGSTGLLGTSSPVQNVQYRSAGVILKVTPTARRDVISLDLHQELSSFQPTTTGVNTSPTLSKDSMTTTIVVRPGEVVLVGGLSSMKAANEDQGLPFLPDFMRTHTRDNERTQLVMVLQATIDGGPASIDGLPEHLPNPTSIVNPRPMIGASAFHPYAATRRAGATENDGARPQRKRGRATAVSERRPATNPAHAESTHSPIGNQAEMPQSYDVR